MLHAARWKCRTQKNRQKVAICAPSYIFATKARIKNRKNLLNSNISSRCSHNMVNFGLLAAENDPVVCPHQLISTAFASWQRYCTAVKYSERQPNFAELNRGRHLCSAGRPSRWALAHILVFNFSIRRPPPSWNFKV